MEATHDALLRKAAPARRDTRAHLLTLALTRRAELLLQLRYDRQSLGLSHPRIGELLAEQRLNDAAIAELEGAQQVAA